MIIVGKRAWINISPHKNRKWIKKEDENPTQAHTLREQREGKKWLLNTCSKEDEEKTRTKKQQHQHCVHCNVCDISETAAAFNTISCDTSAKKFSSLFVCKNICYLQSQTCTVRRVQ